MWIGHIWLNYIFVCIVMKLLWTKALFVCTVTMGKQIPGVYTVCDLLVIPV